MRVPPGLLSWAGRRGLRTECQRGAFLAKESPDVYLVPRAARKAVEAPGFSLAKMAQDFLGLQARPRLKPHLFGAGCSMA